MGRVKQLCHVFGISLIANSIQRKISQVRVGSLQTIDCFVAAKAGETNDKLTSHEPVDNYARWLGKTGRKTKKVNDE